jgi:serine/threonine protein kinase
MTLAGVVLGTAAYMAPEQARGKAVDKRADVWAFGCVLYEMLASRRAFDGEEVSDTLAAVLRAEPDWSALPAATFSAPEMTPIWMDRNGTATDAVAAPLPLPRDPALSTDGGSLR